MDEEGSRPSDSPGANFIGPLEAGTWPKQVAARVVTPGPAPCIHGYDVESELARHYRFSDLVYLSLTGNLPVEPSGIAFDLALTYLLPLSVAHAPVHATVLARLCGASTRGLLGVAATALAEQARGILDGHANLLDALDREEASIPDCALSSDPEDGESVRRLNQLLRSNGIQLPMLRAGLSRTAALLCLLHYSGLRTREQMEAAIVLARIPSALAEGFAEREVNFREYPINLPQYQYEEPP